MSIATVLLELMDNGGRRLITNRRHFSYTKHIPDRRTGEDRRTGIQLRCGLCRRNDADQRSGEMIFKKIQRPENDLREGIDRRSSLDRRVTFAEISAI
jgi:hypothetical protein